MPVPPAAEYQIVAVTDPYGCNTHPLTGLTHFGSNGPTTGIVSVYRRPLPSTNLGFLTTVMWDGREPTLTQQSIDATLTHAQGNAVPTAAQQQQIVGFESGIFTAQIFDNSARDLTAAGANGGPDALASLLSGFFIGINDPLGGQSRKPAIHVANPRPVPGMERSSRTRQGKRGPRGDSTRRGPFQQRAHHHYRRGGDQRLAGPASVSGSCGTCHDTPDVGNHSVKLPINIGVANGGHDNDNLGLDISDLPVFTLACVSGPNAGKTYTVTDPGRALISGKCADVGKLKGPILRGVAARAPYFHNGSAATLQDAVNFYNLRFNIGFTVAQMQDLTAFLQSL